MHVSTHDPFTNRSNSVRYLLLLFLPYSVLLLPGDVQPDAGGHGPDVHPPPVGVCLRQSRNDAAPEAAGADRGRGGTCRAVFVKMRKADDLLAFRADIGAAI